MLENKMQMQRGRT